MIKSVDFFSSSFLFLFLRKYVFFLSLVSLMAIWLLQREMFLRHASKSPCSFTIKWIAPIPHHQEIQYRVQKPKPKLIPKKNHQWHVYRFRARSKGIFHVLEQFEVRTRPRNYLDEDWGMISPKQLPPKLRASCRPLPHWNLTNDDLQPLLDEPWFQEQDLKQWILNAHEKVNRIIKYREHLPERLGALRALNLGYGDCDEFTDLLVALARFRGIPARRLTGYSINPQKNEVTPHAWAELYSMALNEWIPVDAALHILGRHPSTHVVMKIEETVSEIKECSVSTRQCKNEVKFEWQPEKVILLGVG